MSQGASSLDEEYERRKFRIIQAVLNGVYTYEDLVIEKNKEDEIYAKWLIEQELKRQQQNMLTEEIQ